MFTVCIGILVYEISINFYLLHCAHTLSSTISYYVLLLWNYYHDYYIRLPFIYLIVIIFNHFYKCTHEIYMYHD